MQGVAECKEIFRSPQPAVDLIVICGVVAVGCGFKKGTQVEGIYAEGLHVIQPGDDFLQAVDGQSVEIVGLRCAAESEGIDVIKNRIFVPVCHLETP